MTQPEQTTPSRLKDVAALFLRLGFTAFGGPAAHIAMRHDEVVKRRKWLDQQRFLDLFGAVNMILGPSSPNLLLQFRVHSTWPIAGGAIAGLASVLWR